MNKSWFTSARKTDWSPLAGRKCIIWPDNDPQGSTYVTTVTRLLAELEPAVVLTTIDVSKLSLPVGGDIVDFVEALK